MARTYNTMDDVYTRVKEIAKETWDTESEIWEDFFHSWIPVWWKRITYNDITDFINSNKYQVDPESPINDVEDDWTIRSLEWLSNIDDMDNKELIQSIWDVYMDLYLQKRDILKNQKNINSKSRKAQINKEKIDELNEKMARIEDSQEFQDLVESIARWEYEKDFWGNNLVERNILWAIAAKVWTSKTNVKDYSNSWANSAKDNAKYDFLIAWKQFFDNDWWKIVSAANNILNSQITDSNDPSWWIFDESLNKNINTNALPINFWYWEDVYNMKWDKNEYLNKRDSATALWLSNYWTKQVSDDDIWNYLNSNEKFKNAKEEDKQRTFERVKSKLDTEIKKEEKNEDKKSDEEVKEKVSLLDMVKSQLEDVNKNKLSTVSRADKDSLKKAVMSKMNEDVLNWAWDSEEVKDEKKIKTNIKEKDIKSRTNNILRRWDKRDIVDKTIDKENQNKKPASKELLDYIDSLE